MLLLFQTLPVGSLVFSVLATDKDTGSAGVVEYFIKEVSVGPTTLTTIRGSISHTAGRDLEGWVSMVAVQ